MLACGWSAFVCDLRTIATIAFIASPVDVMSDVDHLALACTGKSGIWRGRRSGMAGDSIEASFSFFLRFFECRLFAVMDDASRQKCKKNNNNVNTLKTVWLSIQYQLRFKLSLKSIHVTLNGIRMHQTWPARDL